MFKPVHTLRMTKIVANRRPKQANLLPRFPCVTQAKQEDQTITGHDHGKDGVELCHGRRHESRPEGQFTKVLGTKFEIMGHSHLPTILVACTPGRDRRWGHRHLWAYRKQRALRPSAAQPQRRPKKEHGFVLQKSETSMIFVSIQMCKIP